MCNVINLVKKILSVPTCSTFFQKLNVLMIITYDLQYVILKEVDNTPHPWCPSNVQLHFHSSSSYRMYLRNADRRNREADSVCDCQAYKLSWKIDISVFKRVPGQHLNECLNLLKKNCCQYEKWTWDSLFPPSNFLFFTQIQLLNFLSTTHGEQFCL